MDLIIFEYDALIMCESCTFCEVHMIDIDENRIELNDEHGFVIGMIDVNAISECIVLEYDSNYHLNGAMYNLEEIIDDEELKELLGGE